DLPVAAGVGREQPGDTRRPQQPAGGAGAGHGGEGRSGADGPRGLRVQPGTDAGDYRAGPGGAGAAQERPRPPPPDRRRTRPGAAGRGAAAAGQPGGRPQPGAAGAGYAAKWSLMDVFKPPGYRHPACTPGAYSSGQSPPTRSVSEALCLAYASGW